MNASENHKKVRNDMRDRGYASKNDFNYLNQPGKPVIWGVMSKIYIINYEKKK